MSKYRAGIIRCGQIGKHHARAYKGVEEIELVAAADPVEWARKGHVSKIC